MYNLPVTEHLKYLDNKNCTIFMAQYQFLASKSLKSNIN